MIFKALVSSTEEEKPDVSTEVIDKSLKRISIKGGESDPTDTNIPRNNSDACRGGVGKDEHLDNQGPHTLENVQTTKHPAAKTRTGIPVPGVRAPAQAVLAQAKNDVLPMHVRKRKRKRDGKRKTTPEGSLPSPSYPQEHQTIGTRDIRQRVAFPYNDAFAILDSGTTLTIVPSEKFLVAGTSFALKDRFHIKAMTRTAKPASPHMAVSSPL